ncbi:YncE family protein [Actinoplanes sp. NPDC023714]|uniref:WD40 repeat domain-containing protein n=1 Tax=Actinoplanes sp. NPDC023714 TaxID=3154322 RepID=UPI003410D962
MAGPSLVIRFGAGRITLAIDDDTVSGLPAVRHRDTAAAASTTPAALSGLFTEVLREAVPPVPRRLTVICPVGWDEEHRTAMTRAAAAAGVSAPSFLIGPVAVAHAVATGLRRRRAAAVVTLGGPLAEVAILIRTRTGFTLLGDPSKVLVPHTPEGRRRVVGELLTTIAGAGLTAEQLAGVYVVGDTEPGAPLAAEIQKTLGVATSARRELETAAVDGALTAYPPRRRGPRRRTLLAAASVIALMIAAVGGMQLRGSAGPPGARFVAATAAPAPLVHVLDADAGTLTTLDPATGGTSPASPVPAGEADWFRLTPDGRTAVIGNIDGVTLIDTATRRVRAYVPLPGATASVVSPDGRTLSVLTRPGPGEDTRIVPVDLATGIPGEPIPAGRRPGQLAGGPGGVLYVLEPAQRKASSGARLDIVDTAAGTTRHVPLHPGAREIAPAPDGRKLYVAADRWVGPYDGTLRPPLAMPGKVAALAVTPDGRSLYVLCKDAVVAVDVATDRIRATIPLAGVGNAWRLSASPDSRRVYVYGSTDVPAIGWIDTATDRAGLPIRVGAQPGEILHRSDGGAAYVLTRLDEKRSALVTVDVAAAKAGRVLALPPGPVMIATP